VHYSNDDGDHLYHQPTTGRWLLTPTFAPHDPHDQLVAPAAWLAAESPLGRRLWNTWVSERW
jgi:hypothetical protein